MGSRNKKRSALSISWHIILQFDCENALVCPQLLSEYKKHNQMLLRVFLPRDISALVFGRDESYNT
jgi:hypothetical protein